VLKDPPFCIDVTEEAAGVRRVRVSGDLDLQTTPELEAVLARNARQAHEVVLDLSEVTFVDSTGISLIIQTDAVSRQDGFGLSMTVSPPVLRVLRLCDLERLLPIRPN
jgi:anti-sigma B factor antagonist